MAERAEVELATFAQVYELLLSHPIRSAFREGADGAEGEPPPQDEEMLVAVQADRFSLMTAVRELRRAAQQELFAGAFATLNLWPVIQWLEGGCDPKWAAKELRIYADRLGQLEPRAGQEVPGG
jgi:hypothetical protein